MKRISKITALIMFALMIFIVVPASALAIEEDVFIEEGIQVKTRLTELIEPAVEESFAEETLVDEAIVTEPQALAETNIVPIEEPLVGETEALPKTAIAPIEEPLAEVAATAYLALIKGGMTINVLANTIGEGYSFDAANNSLTLTDFTGEQLLARVLGETFSLIFHGQNTLGTDAGFAIDVDGDLSLNGTGVLIAAGSAANDAMGGGIRAAGDIIIDGGTYYLRGLAGKNTGSAIGILAGNTDDINITRGNLIINDGIFNIRVMDDSTNGAFGTFAFGDQTIYGGDFNIATYSHSGSSTSMGAMNNLIFHGGIVDAYALAAPTGTATNLFAGDWIMINDGIFDLIADGGSNPRVIHADGGIYLDPCYGDVDLTATELHLSCGYTTYDPIRTSTKNPKTGVETLPMEALLASLSLLALVGLAVIFKKQAFQK